MAIEIVEVIGRCSIERGVLEPFICIDEAGDTYYLKGSNCTAHGSIAEWLASNLAKAFGLQVPEPVIARLGEDLIDEMSFEWQVDLKYEYYFASAGVPFAQPPNHSQLKSVSAGVRADLAVFDYWIHNEDRTSGNVNLLFEPGTGELHVIDFNNAFASGIDITTLSQDHVFGDRLQAVAGDMFQRQSYQDRMEQALQGLEGIIGQIPEEWIDLSTPQEGYTEQMRAILTRFRDSDFWGPLL